MPRDVGVKHSSDFVAFAEHLVIIVTEASKLSATEHEVVGLGFHGSARRVAHELACGKANCLLGKIKVNGGRFDS
jgi:hypothetical protein